MGARDDGCQHRPVSPGQGVCSCLDTIMWLRLLVELSARRIVELEREVQSGKVGIIAGSDAWARYQINAVKAKRMKGF